MTPFRAVLDTGIAFALADRSDSWHAPAVAWISSLRPRLIVPITIVPEVTYLVRSRKDEQAELAYVRSLAEEWDTLEPLQDVDLNRAADLMQKYPTIGFVDATVVAIAERLRVETIATTDRRDFLVVRPAHIDRFRLAP